MERMMNRTTIAILIAGCLAAVAAGVTMRHSTSARAATTIDPNGYVRHISNPWLPFRVDSKWVYRGVKDGQAQRDTVRVTRQTKTIMGVRCTAVSDIATHAGTVLERTTDWYAQDRKGNVWYFGERTAEYSNGTVDHSGSWLAGVHGAQPGIVMTTHPAVGDAFRQEYWPGHAEDQYWLVDLNRRVVVPYGAFHHAALTLEWSRLEPNVIDRKLYVRGIGNVSEVTAQGPHETAELVSYRRG
jgi:hypothetical protein